MKSDPHPDAVEHLDVDRVEPILHVLTCPRAAPIQGRTGGRRPSPSFKSEVCRALGGDAADVPAGGSVQRAAVDADHGSTLVFPGVVDPTDQGAVEAVGGDLFGELLLFLATGLGMEWRLRGGCGEAAEQGGANCECKSRAKDGAAHLLQRLSFAGGPDCSAHYGHSRDEASPRHRIHRRSTCSGTKAAETLC